MRVMTWAVVAAAGLVSAACLDTVGIDPAKQTTAAVTGQILKPDGVTGVGGPIVSIELLEAPVGGSQKLISQTAVTADANGRFLFLFLLNNTDPQNAVANLSVTAPIASGLVGRDTLNIPVKIVRSQVPTDTAYVQLTLTAR